MENFKFGLFSVTILAVIGLLFFWSVGTIQSGADFKISEKIERLQDENEALKKESEELKDELAVLQEKINEEVPVLKPEAPAEERPAPAPKPAATVYKNQALINELERLIKDNIFMKLKSSGSRVGTVQKFLNVRNKTSSRVDNDYGASTKAAVAAFQKAEGLTADGEAGPETFRKMVEWLKERG